MPFGFISVNDDKITNIVVTLNKFALKNGKISIKATWWESGKRDREVGQGKELCMLSLLSATFEYLFRIFRQYTFGIKYEFCFNFANNGNEEKQYYRKSIQIPKYLK